MVHIQYEQGLYRLVLDLMNCDKTPTNIDSFFYDDCKVQLSPLVEHTSNSKSAEHTT